MTVEEIKKTLDEQGKAWHQFVEKNEERLKTHDGILNENVEQLANVIADLQEKSQRLDRIEAAASRIGGTVDDNNNEFELEQKKNLKDFFRKGSNKSVELLHAKDELEVLKTLRESIGPDGGYIVRPDLSNYISTFLYETSPIRQLASVITIGSNEHDFLYDNDEAGAEWIGETGTITNVTTPQFQRGRITAEKIGTMPAATNEMLEDAYFDPEGWLRSKVADKFARTENTAFLTGNGVSKPRGFLTYSAWTTPGTFEQEKIEQINSGNASDITANGIIELQGSLKEAYQNRAVFMMKRSTFVAIQKLSNGVGDYLVGFGTGPGNQPIMTLRGRSVILADDMPAIASSALSIAYGDFSAYRIVDRRGLTILRDPYSLGAQDMVRFVTTKRVGGGVTNFDAIKIQKIAV